MVFQSVNRSRGSGDEMSCWSSIRGDARRSVRRFVPQRCSREQETTAEIALANRRANRAHDLTRWSMSMVSEQPATLGPQERVAERESNGSTRRGSGTHKQSLHLLCLRTQRPDLRPARTPSSCRTVERPHRLQFEFLIPLVRRREGVRKPRQRCECGPGGRRRARKPSSRKPSPG